MKTEYSRQDERLWEHHQVENGEYFEAGHRRQDKILWEIRRRLKPQSRILEIGFGDGYLLHKLSSFFHPFGADISQKNVDQVKKREGNRIEFTTIGIDGTLPYPDAHFDGFVASEVLEHMDTAELVRCVEEIRRVLRKGGIAFLTFPAKENLKDNECFCPHCGLIFHKWGHKQRWDEQNIDEVFSGFTRLSLKEFFLPHEGKGFLENLLGRAMWLLRTVLQKFLPLPGATYMLIVQKK
ncbi:MAG: class I SAM-dependent methyltransferase [Candidatus Moraniibacteriota bacterium]|nr:MAG: class I SAM-dependent methyltransferase [Candidatus Moranbacteria bacterium]